MKITLVLVLMIASLSSYAQVKHLVFDIEGIVTRQIPKANYDKFLNKDQMIEVKSGTVTKYFYIRPHVSYLLNYFQKRSGFVIHFLSDSDRTFAQNLLARINLPKPIDKSVASFIEGDVISKLFTQEDLTDGKLDLRKISSDLKNIILFTTRSNVLLPEQKASEIQLPNLYYFETYDQALAEMKALEAKGYLKAHQANFAASEEEWNAEHHKSAYIYHLLKSVKAARTKDLVEALASTKVDFIKGVNEGLKVAKYNFEEEIIVFEYNKDKTKVLGCRIYKTETETLDRPQPMDQCRKRHSIKYDFKIDLASRKVLGCFEFDEAYSAEIGEAELYHCEETKKSAIKYYWLGETRISCGAYYNDKYFLAVADVKLCTYEHMVEINGELSVKPYFEIDGKLVGMIGDIVSLARGAMVPYDVFNKYDSKFIAMSLMESIYQRREKHHATINPNYDFKNDSNIIMAFSYELTPKIMDKGFLNQHQIGASRGMLDPKYRANNEDRFLELVLEKSYSTGFTAPNLVRPKFAYLFLTKFRKDMTLTVVETTYGNIYAKFSDEVKNRSTFYNGNSLGIHEKPGNVRTFQYTSTSVLSKKSWDEYWEAQIWGELTKDDVEYLLVNCPSYTPLTSAQIEYMKKFGIPVYQCMASYGYETSHITNLYKGKQL